MINPTFKAKSVETGEWVHGNLVGRTGYTVFSKYYIVTSDEGDLTFTEIDTDTLGQYIGLDDRNGVKIYKGDLIKHVDLPDAVGEVVFDRGAFVIKGIFDEEGKPSSFLYNIDPKHCEVIGNVMEAPNGK